MRAGSPQVIAFLALLLARLAASSQAFSADPAQELLARQFAAAVQTRESGKMEQLLHPKVRACIDASNREYFDYLINNFQNTPPADYIVTITPLQSKTLPPIFPADMFTYPVQPTHQLEIEWNSGPNSYVSLIRTIADVNGTWFVVYPCPNAAGVKFVHEQLVRGREQQARALALASTIEEPLRKELKTLLTQGQKIDAIKKYQAATGTDRTTAVNVMNVLETAK